VRVNGLDALAITKMDVLDGFPTLKICTAYTVHGETLEHFPSEIGQLARCEPVYREVPGWTAPTAGAKRFEDLPAEARAYIAALEEVCGVPVALISTGSDRHETILRQDSIAARWFTLPD
jgi:adenylosuccinate synthase